MNRVIREGSGVVVSPKQKRLSVGFGTTASVQIHVSATPPTNILPRSGTPPTSVQIIDHEMSTPSGKRMSMHENLLLRILSSTPSDQPLFRRNSSDATPLQRTADDSFDSCLSGSNTPTLDLLNASPDAMRCNTPPATGGAITNRHLQMLHRDLNSPSATARLRALRALKSPSKRNAYGNFDVSYAQQDIITAEERMEPEKRDIRDVLSHVCVYVEVRSGTDNRSDGIKEHVASLGAKVNERLLKDTTHVIFKDGLLSTYQKAKKMNVPVVSVLWIEACKRHMCLMNPDDFKISNVERYENPDLFKRIRRQKSMQPGAEETVGNKKRTAVAGKTKAPPVVVSPPSKLPVLHRMRKDDRLERILSEFEADNHIASENTGPVDEYDEMLQAAPMRMLERFRSTPTNLDSPADRLDKRAVDDDAYSTPKGVPDAVPEADTATRRALFATAGSGSKQSLGGAAASRSNRRTILFTPKMTNVVEENITSNTPICVEDTPKEPLAVRGRRRTIVGGDKVASDKSTPPTVGAKVRRKTILAVEDNESGPSAPTPTNRTRRSSVASGKDQNVSPVGVEQSKESINLLAESRTNRRKTIVASKENISPTVLRSPMADGKKERSSTVTRSRRKTVVAFGIDENTPPTATRALLMADANTQAMAKRGTIRSPKEMEISTVPQVVNVPTAATLDLTKVNSKGSEMSISSAFEGPIEKTPASKTEGKQVGRRRTLFNPSPMVEGSRTTSGKQDGTTRSSVVSNSSTSVRSERRKTLFTPGNSTFMEPLEVSETPAEPSNVRSQPGSTLADGSSICNRPDPTSSSTPKPITANARPKTLLEEYEESLQFSSTRAPERRRRTIFDISMDIMDKRLSEINRQAAAAKRHPGEEEPVIVPQRPDNLLSPPPPPRQQKSLDEFYRKAIRSSEKSNKSTDPSTDSVTQEEPVVAPRKRKLFNVQSSEEQPIPMAASKTGNVKTTTKRRSLAPAVGGTIVPAVPAAVAAAAARGKTNADAKRRRTTALFESPYEPQPATQQEGLAEPKKKPQFPVGRGLPTMASQYNQGPGEQQTQQGRQYLATTNLHTEQTAFVKEAIETLDGFIIEPDVTDHTTHLVTLEPRRTINLLRALVRGLWIVRYDWIVESFRARRWLQEEQFEVRDFSPAVQINRSERQAFGSQYRSELFADYGPFWITPLCAVPVRQLRELLLLCRGKVTGNKLKAKFLVLEGDDDDDERLRLSAADGQICVTALWVLDSITANKETGTV